MSLIRALGILVIFLTAIGGGSPVTAAVGEDPPGQCYDYTMDRCTPQGSCEELAGKSCGGQLGSTCEDEGTIACAFHSGCENAGELAQICQFDGGGGGPD